MFKYSVNIKQHTPIIHFQADQYGATLRATELKPKLDKFLIKYAFDEDDNYEHYLLKNSSAGSALDYKIQVNEKSVPVEVKYTFNTRKNSLYFGNMGDKNKDKFFTMKSDGIFSIGFFSYNAKLIEKIKLYFPAFLAITNFGTRQNKGFGSFYVFDRQEKVTIEKLKEQLKMCGKKFLYICYKGKQNNITAHYETILNDVDIIYKLMKSGINFKETERYQSCYYKGYIYAYMLNKGIGNEKKFIKENYFSTEVRVPSDGMEKKYVRAMLGVFKNLKFRDDDRRGDIEFSNDKIQRYKSPITFKIIDNYLLIIAEDIENREDGENEIFNQKFKVTHEFNGRITSRDIMTPGKDDFNLWEFMIGFKDYFNKLQVPSSGNPMEFKLKNAKRQRIEVGE